MQKRILSVLLKFIILISLAIPCYGQQKYDNPTACNSITNGQPWQPNGIVYNPATGNYKINACIDNFGNVTWVNSNGASFASNLNTYLTNPKYNAKMNVQFCYGNVSTVTVTNGSPTVVTCSTGFVNPAIGMPIYATNGCCGVGLNFGSLLTASTGATVTGINSSTSLNISGTATNCSGSTCIIVYGNIDDTAISAAETDWQSSPKCSDFVLPAAFVGIQNPHWNNPGTQCNGAEPAIDFTASVKGEGQGVSGLVPFPPFNFAGCTFGPGSNGCFFGYQEAVVEDLVFYAAGWSNTGNNSKTLFNMTTGTLTSHVSAIGFGASDTSLVCMASVNFNQAYNLIIDGCGASAVHVTSGQFGCWYCNIQDTGGAVGSIYVISSGATVLDFGGTYGGSSGTAWIDIAGTFKGWGTSNFGPVVTNNTTFFYLSNNANATMFCDGCNVNMNHTGSIGIFSDATTQSIVLVNSTVGGTGGNQILLGTSILKDLGNNNFPGLFPVGTLLSGAFVPYRSVNGAATGVGTASSTLALRVSGTSITGAGIPTTFTSTTLDAGAIMDHAGTLSILQVQNSAAGINASSGVVTVLKNGGATTLTCTIGTSTTGCFDGTHTATFVAGDLISYSVTTQAADTLAGVKASVSAY